MQRTELFGKSLKSPTFPRLLFSLMFYPKLPQESTSLERGYVSSPRVLRAAKTSIFTRAAGVTALDILAENMVLMC